MAETLIINGARGESLADIVRRIGYGGALPGDSDSQAISKALAQALGDAGLSNAVTAAAGSASAAAGSAGAASASASAAAAAASSLAGLIGFAASAAWSNVASGWDVAFPLSTDPISNIRLANSTGQPQATIAIPALATGEFITIYYRVDRDGTGQRPTLNLRNTGNTTTSVAGGALSRDGGWHALELAAGATAAGLLQILPTNTGASDNTLQIVPVLGTARASNPSPTQALMHGIMRALILNDNWEGMTTAPSAGRPRNTDPATGTTWAAGTWIWPNEPATKRILRTHARVRTAAAGDVTIKIFSNPSPGIWVVEAERVVTAPAAGLHFLAFATPVWQEVGWAIGGYAANGIIYYVTGGTGDSGGYAAASNNLPAFDMSGASLVTTTILQVGVDGVMPPDPLPVFQEAAATIVHDKVEAVLGADIDAYGATVAGLLGSFTPASAQSNTAAYGPNELQSGRPKRVTMRTSGTGPGKLLRIDAKSGLIRDVLALTPDASGTTVLGPANFAAWSYLPAYFLIWRLDGAGNGGLRYLNPGTGPNVTVQFTASAGQAVGDRVTLTYSIAKMAMLIETEKMPIAARLAAAEATVAAARRGTTRRLSAAAVPALLGGTALNHFISYGQSNSNGIDSLPLLNTTPSVRHLKFNPTMRMTKPGLAGATAESADLTGTLALVEDDLDNVAGQNGGETFSTQFALSLSRNIRDVTTIPRLLLSAAGKGGANIATLGVGGAWYPNLPYHVTAGKREATALGIDYQVPAVFDDHGEADQAANATSYATYLAAKGALIDQFRTDYQTASGKTNAPLWFISTACKSITGQNGIVGVAEAQYDLCGLRTDCVMVGPAYRYPYINDSHLTAAGQDLKAEYNRRAFLQARSGAVPDRIYWGKAEANGTELVIYAEGPTALRFVTDDPVVGPVADYGFAVKDDTGTLTLSNFRVDAAYVDVDGRLVTVFRITLNRTLGTNPLVSYAKSAIYSGATVTGGGAGNVCDSTTDTATINGTAYPLYHYAPPRTWPVALYE